MTDDAIFTSHALAKQTDEYLGEKAWTLERMVLREQEKLKKLVQFQAMIEAEAKRRGYETMADLLVKYSGFSDHCH